MIRTSRAVGRFIAVPAVVTTVLALGPGLTGVAMAVPPVGSFLNPSTSGPGTVVSSKADGTDSTYRFAVRASDPDNVGIASVQIQIEGCGQTSFSTIGTATQVGTTDTFVFNWDLSTYTPSTAVTACATGQVQAFVTDRSGETSIISAPNPVSFLDSTAETVAITNPANGGTVGFFNSGATNKGFVAGTASAGTTAVTVYYSTSAVGTAPNWTSCGSDSAPATVTGGTKTWAASCDITTATTATNVTALAAVPTGGTGDSGDAVRVTGYAQTLQSFTINPTSDTQSVGFCNTYTVQVRDQNGAAIAGAPIQVQVKGTATGAAGDAEDVIKFAANNAVEGTASDPFSTAPTTGATSEASNQCDSAGEPDGRPDDVDGTAGPNESVLSGGASNDLTAATKAITGTTAANGNFRFSLSLTSAQTAAAGTFNITAFLDANGDGVQNSGEVGNTATKVFQAQSVTTLTATPTTGTNVVGETHVMTATVTDQNGNPVSGQVVTFRVMSGPNANVDIDNNNTTPTGVIGQCTTAANGQCTQSYSSATAGTDSIAVFLDTNSNFIPDSGEKQQTISETWVTTTNATCLDAEPNTADNPTTSSHVITAYVTDGAMGPKGDVSGQNDCTGNPLANVPVDFTITHDVPDATLSPDTDNNPDHERVFTNAQGIAQVTLTDNSSSATGTDLVSAAIPGSGFSTVTPNLEDISTSGTSVPVASACDDCISPSIALPFTFTYDSTPFNGVYVGSNGFMKFANTDSDDGCCSGESFPNTDTPNGGVIGGFWTDLLPSAGGSVTYQTLGTAPNRRFVVEFKNVPFYPGTGSVTFEIKLFEGTNNVEVDYGNTSVDSHTSSGGVENLAGTAGTQYFLGSSSDVSNTAVQYSPAAVSGRRAEVVSKSWNVAGTPATITCAPTTARNVQNTQHTVTCTVLDHFKNPVAGQHVAFRVTSGPDSTWDLDGNPTTPPGFFGDVTTNTQGQASATYTNLAGASNTPDTITAWVDANNNQTLDGGELNTTVTKYWTSQANISGSHVAIDMNPTGTGTNDTPVGTANTVKCNATLTGANFGTTAGGWDATTSGQIQKVEAVCVSVLGADGTTQYGEAVTLTSSGAGVLTSADGTAAGTTTQTEPVDPASGYAEFYITSSASGTQTLTATAANTSATATGTKTWTSLEARNITLVNVGGSTATPGTVHDVKATVTDRLGNPVANQEVDFSESGPGRFLNGTSTEPSTVVVHTGADGTVTVELTTLSSESGTETVTATLPTAGTECTDPAGTPTGATAGNCAATVTISWQTAPPACTNPTINLPPLINGDHAVLISGMAAPGATVVLFQRTYGTPNYVQAATVTADSSGAYSFTRWENIQRTYYTQVGSCLSPVKLIQVRVVVHAGVTSPSRGTLVIHVVTGPPQPGRDVRIYRDTNGTLTPVFFGPLGAAGQIYVTLHGYPAGALEKFLAVVYAAPGLLNGASPLAGGFVHS